MDKLTDDNVIWVLTALRTPSDRMIKAAVPLWYSPKQMFEAMIDVALGEARERRDRWLRDGQRCLQPEGPSDELEV